jgi:S-formylglutathione hydrolase FrmB
MAVMDVTLYSDALGFNTHVRIIFPQDIKKNEKLRVLYLLHGYMGDYTDWSRFTSIERYNWPYRFVIVMPSIHNSYYTDAKFGLNFFTFVAKELPSFIQSYLPVSMKREDTFVAGLSMGGYGALKIALTYPDRYAKAASLSGALDIDDIQSYSKGTPREPWFLAIFGENSARNTGNDLNYLVKDALDKKKILPDLFIGCGTEDFLYQINLDFKAFLDQHHVSYTYHESKGDHSWAFWDEYIQKVLAWI